MAEPSPGAVIHNELYELLEERNGAAATNERKAKILLHIVRLMDSPELTQSARQWMFVDAIRYGDYDAVETLALLGNVKIDGKISTHYGKTPLYWAVIGNHLSIARYLLKNKVDPNAPDNGSLLHIAVELGHFNMVKLLVENGVDLTKQKSRWPGDPKATALERAKQKGHTEITAFLRKALAQPLGGSASSEGGAAAPPKKTSFIHHTV